MHFLKRAKAPACLAKYQYGVDQWDRHIPTQAERADILAELEAMQGRRCAYCEGSLDTHGQHIEHFRQRGRHPAGTFEWTNLFWSCKREDSCGKHKDKSGHYTHSDLIKPDVDIPERFFLFASNGTIAIRTSTLTKAEQDRARETLRIFNLDEEWGTLRKARAVATSGYLIAAKELMELSALCSPQDLQSYLESEYGHTRDLPYCTAIQHTLTSA